MANGIRTGDPRGFNKGHSSKLPEGSRVRQTPEEYYHPIWWHKIENYVKFTKKNMMRVEKHVLVKKKKNIDKRYCLQKVKIVFKINTSQLVQQ